MVKHRSTLQILFLVLNVVWGALYFGYGIAYLNPATDTIVVQFSIDLSKKDLIIGLLNALLPLGAAAGAFSSAQFLSVLSMRHSIMATDAIGICGCLLELYFNLYTLIPARVLVGFAIGLNSAFVPQYIKEFSPINLSGSMGALNQMTINTGILLALSLGIGFNSAGTEGDYLRLVFAIPVGMCIMRTTMLLLIFKDEPPRYYIQIRRPSECKRVLTKMYDEEYVDELFNQMDQQAKNKDEYTYKDMITSAISVRVFIGCGLSILQQLSGINAIQFYSTKIFQDYYPENKDFLNIGVGATNCIFSLMAIPVLSKLGRRPLLLYGTEISAVILSVLALMAYFVSHSIIENPLVVVLLIFAYLAVFQFSLGPVVWIYIADILPEKGVSIAVLANWVTCAIVGQLFPILSDYGLDLCFLIFAVCCIIGVFFVYRFVPEVKDRSHSKIEQLFMVSLNEVSASDN